MAPIDSIKQETLDDKFLSSYLGMDYQKITVLMFMGIKSCPSRLSPPLAAGPPKSTFITFFIMAYAMREDLQV